MAGGQVNTLVIIGWNPVFTAPADLEFRSEPEEGREHDLSGAGCDETAAVSKWVIPAAHYLESWGDAMAPDGTASIQQPTIQPLYGGKTAAELVAAISGI